jgi:serine/threonine protein kinase
VRWMAPEALQFGEYSHASDVWSMGVVVWEVFENGEMPYPSLGDDDVQQQVLTGMRMSRPDECPPPVWDLAEECWLSAPSRPTFKQLFSLFNRLLRDSVFIRELSEHIDRVPSIRRLSQGSKTGIPHDYSHVVLNSTSQTVSRPPLTSEDPRLTSDSDIVKPDAPRGVLRRPSQLDVVSEE